MKIGTSFMPFSLPAYFPEKKKEEHVTLKTFSGKWLILFYYPADFTYVCPTELRDIARRYAEIKALSCEVLAVSTDTIFTHKAWQETEQLLLEVTYPMAADHAGVLARHMGIYNEKDGLADRATFIIDPDGVLQSVEIVAENIGRSAAELVRKLTALDHVRKHPHHACPASWEIGQKDLIPSLDISGKVAKEL